jgi:hypothetical protein
MYLPGKLLRSGICVAEEVKKRQTAQTPRLHPERFDATVYTRGRTRSH